MKLVTWKKLTDSLRKKKKEKNFILDTIQGELNVCGLTIMCIKIVIFFFKNYNRRVEHKCNNTGNWITRINTVISRHERSEIQISKKQVCLCGRIILLVVWLFARTKWIVLFENWKFVTLNIHSPYVKNGPPPYW